MSGRRTMRAFDCNLAPELPGSTTAYLAGPMRGRPQQNAAQFADATMALRASGWVIHSPSEYDIAAGMDLSTPDDEIQVALLLRDDFKILLQCDYIILLPGWRESAGSRIELAVALYSGMAAKGLGRTVGGEWYLANVNLPLPTIVYEAERTSC